MKKNVKNFGINYRDFLRLMSLVVILFVLVPAMANAQSGKANFSGTWAMNADKSNLGNAGGGGRGFGGGGNMVVNQDNNTLTIERTMNRQGQETKMTTKYTLDGKETVNTTGRGESKSTAKWSADGKSLTITTTSSFNGNDRTSKEVWTLKDAKTLSIASTRPNRNGEETTTTRVYDKGGSTM